MSAFRVFSYDCTSDITGKGGGIKLTSTSTTSQNLLAQNSPPSFETEDNGKGSIFVKPFAHACGTRQFECDAKKARFEYTVKNVMSV